MNERHVTRSFAAPLPLVEEARERLTRDACPRRYCWYWVSLSFDWDVSLEQGCQVALEHPVDALLTRAGAQLHPWRMCCRATGNALHRDYFEPREPHLEADGWPSDFFNFVGKAARTRRFERRRLGG